MPLPRIRLWYWLVLVPLCVVLAAALAIWLRALSSFLVRDDGPAPAEIAVVLAGDSYGWRVLKAGDLVREGYVPKALVSGQAGLYQRGGEATLAVEYAVSKGYPKNYFDAFNMAGHSTEEECALILSELRRRNIRSVLLVTSDYHTRRAGRLFHRVAPGMQLHVVAARDQWFRPDDWWGNRQSRRTFFLEYTKTLASWFHI